MRLAHARALAWAAACLVTLNDVSLSISEEAGWSYGPPMPEIRTEPGAGVIGTRIYVVGGSTREVDTLASGMVRDMTATGSWTSIAPMPSGLNHLSVVTLANNLYVLGGFAGRAPGETGSRLHQGATSHVYRYDPKEDRWDTMASLPVARGSVGAAVIDGKIHVVGGRNIDLKTVTDHNVYDPATNTWSSAAPLPRARDHMFVVAARGRLHVIGGRFDSRDENASDYDVYDPATDSWSKGPPLPTPRSGGQSGLLGNLIVTFGGENSKKTFDDLEAFNLDSGQWQIQEPAPTGLHASAGAVVKDSINFAGGSTGPGGDSITNQVLVYRIRPGN